MAETDKLYITISYGDGTNGASGKKGTQDIQSKSKENALRTYATHEFLHVIKSSAETSFNSSIAMIGNLTGEYYKQMKIQEGLSIVNDFVDIGMGAMSGFTLSGGNPVGAVIGAGVVVVGKVVNWGFDRANLELSMAKTNRDIDLLRMRSGLNSLYDGSRGTEN